MRVCAPRADGVKRTKKVKIPVKASDILCDGHNG